MAKWYSRLPASLGSVLLGVWLIGMALPGSPVHGMVEFAGYTKILGIVLAAAGVCTLLGR
jgi:hypothetical protein